MPAVNTSFIRHSISAKRILHEQSDLFWKVDDVLQHFQEPKFLHEVEREGGDEGEVDGALGPLFVEEGIQIDDDDDAADDDVTMTMVTWCGDGDGDSDCGDDNLLFVMFRTTSRSKEEA